MTVQRRIPGSAASAEWAAVIGVLLASVLTARTGGGLWPISLLAGLAIIWLSNRREDGSGQQFDPGAMMALVIAMALATLTLAGAALLESGGAVALGLLAAGVMASAAATFVAARRQSDRRVPRVLVLVGAVLVGLAGAASTNVSDATLAHDVAGELVLDGRSPWRDLGVPESNPYRMGEMIDGYSYPPPTLLVFGVIGTLLPDNRLLVAVLWCGVVWLAHRWYPTQSWWLPSCLVLIPGYPLAVEQSWTEPLTVLLVLASLGMTRVAPSGLLWGLAVASKQYMLVGLAGLPPIARRHRYFVALLSLGLLIGIIPVVLDLSGAWQALVTFHADRPVRPDSSNLTGWLALISGRTDRALPSAAVLSAAALVAAWTAWRGRDSANPWLSATTAALASSLVLGPASLPNYWIVVAALVLLMLAEHESSVATPSARTTSSE